MIWVRHVARIWRWKMRTKLLVEKPEGKRPRHRLEDNIKMNLKEIGGGFIWLRIGTGGGLLLTR
jgi:hypothetical protein